MRREHPNRCGKVVGGGGGGGPSHETSGKKKLDLVGPCKSSWQGVWSSIPN